jgi:uncharacterized metal-binding protein
MARVGSFMEWQAVSGSSVRIGDVTVTPVSQALVIRWPNGGFIWNRPSAVLVERNGQTERVLIPDVTRVAQVGLLFSIMLLSVVTAIAAIRQRRNQDGW